ncbi:MAG: protoporphyrinogen oxidase, partial [Chloroflexi bacterium]|nr:protoporphyrinogen oxidase [Chloroflexota bacterium]
MSRPQVSVAIVGGGITGLATAYYLERAAEEEGWELRGTLVEQEPHLGGKLYTAYEDGFLVEGGPDSFIISKPWAVEMAQNVGIDGDLVSQTSHGALILHGGKLHTVPAGLAAGLPTRPWAIWQSSLLSLKGKLRASLEPFIPRRRDEGDESLGSFLRRRLGNEVAQRLAEPFTASIHSGDALQLSLHYLFPTLVEMERRHGSLARGLRAAARSRPRGAAPASPFRSFGRGVASLPQAIADSLGSFTLLKSKRVTGLTLGDAAGPRFQLALHDGDPIPADHVVLTNLARSAAYLTQGVAPRVATLLEKMSYASTASVSLAFRRENVGHPLNGSGFLVPRTEPGPITACTWSSSKWAGRAPEGWVLLRAFVGWANDDSFMEQDDPSLVRSV